jgi:membrane protease subunit HflC
MASAREQKRARIRAQGPSSADHPRRRGRRASRTYAQSFGKDPDFYDFYSRMQSYQTTFVNNGRAADGRPASCCRPENEYLREFRGGRGNAKT